MKKQKSKLPKLTKEQTHELLKSIGALDVRRKIEGEEREKLFMLFNMMEPTEQSNNQHSWTDTYKIGKRIFHVHFWPGVEEAEVEEYIKYKEPKQKRNDQKEIKSKLGYSRIGRNNI